MLSTILLALGLITSSPTLADLEPGQVWTMGAKGYEQTQIIIGPIQSDANGETVIHIGIENMPAPPNGTAPSIGHLPVDAEYVVAALGSQVSSNASLNNIERGMEVWAAENGGVFTIPVTDILEMVVPAAAAELPKQP